MSLTEKTVTGLIWSFADNLARLGIMFLVGIVLARLLTPREFGLIGMTSIFIAVANSFVQSGFTQALIRKQNCSQTDYATVFFFNLLVSAVFYVLLYISAGLISRFFQEPLLRPVIRVLGLVLIINGLTIVQQAQLTKAINFRLQTIISVISSLVSGAIGIYMAFNGFGVWSLVATTLSGSAVTALLLWLWNGWRPSWTFSQQSFTEMFSFGSRLLLSGLIETIYQNIYLLIIGRFFSASALGYFSRAQSYKDIPSQNLTIVIQRVSYPVLATLQDDLDQLRVAYRTLIKNTMLVTFVLMLGMVAVAEPLVLGLVGEQWAPSVIYLQLLCFAGLLYPLHALNLNMLQVQGRSDLFLRLEVIKKVLAVPTIILGILYGIEVMIIGMIVNSIIAFLLNSYWSGRFIDYSSMQQFIDIFPALVLSLGMAGIVYAAGYTLFIELPYLARLLLQIALGGLLTVGLGETVRLDSYLDIKQITLDRLHKKGSTSNAIL